VFVVFVVFVVLAACEEPSPGTGSADQDIGDLEIEGRDDPVAGELAGEAFETVDAYFRAFRVGGEPHVDLVFAEVAQDDCGLPLPREGRRVFVRFDGVSALSPGESIVSRDGDGAVSIHYERAIDGRQVGVGAGVARLSLDTVSDSRVLGRIHACFDDGQASCVGGAFTARICLSRLDGHLPREGTGVADPPGAEEAPR
jgi:hypothetical protein